MSTTEVEKNQSGEELGSTLKNPNWVGFQESSVMK